MIQLDDKNPNERLGAFLARVRESQGLSVEDLSLKTKISVSILQKIEASDWKAFPVEAYVRSYLNSLSAKLGLDSKAVLKIYSDETGSNYAVRDMEPLMRNIAPITEEEKAPRSKAVPIAIAILAVLLFVGLHFMTKFEVSSEAKANPPAAVVSEETPEMNQDMPEGAEVVPLDSIKEEKSERVTQAVVDKAMKKSENLPASATIFISASSKKDSVPATVPVSDNGRTKIELVGSGEMRSWVGIKRDEDDDEFVKEANIATVDNKLVYTSTGTLYIVIGEPRAIGKMYLNGVETPIPESKFGRVVRFSVYDGRVLQ